MGKVNGKKTYWTVKQLSGKLVICEQTFCGDEIDMWNKFHGNLFKTEKECEKYLDYVKRLAL